MVDIALAFVLAHPAASCAIPGMKPPDQARANVAAAAAVVELTDDEMATIRAASAGPSSPSPTTPRAPTPAKPPGLALSRRSSRPPPAGLPAHPPAATCGTDSARS